MIKKYKKGWHKIQYSRPGQFFRVYNYQDEFSLFRREIKNFLKERLYDDIDIVASGPSILINF